MSYLVLARKWRPRRFDELVGQDHVRRALTNALDSGRIHHAFLFTGTRGVGKTTIARIFAKALNCERGVSSTPCGECGACRDIDAGRFVDLLEVDAASRTKVDDTRELLDNVQYSPARGRYKVYLIDEVHMLSAHSFNALLKTLEEPPPHVKFLLATTDPQKLPITVLSRCLQFHLRRLPPQQIIERLTQIAQAEKVEFEPGALRAIARGAEGSMRDALSLLDQVLAFGGGRALEAEARSLLGTLDRRHVEAILTALAAGDGKALMQSVAMLDERAPDYHQALGELAGALQRMALLQALPELKTDAVDEDEALVRTGGALCAGGSAALLPDRDHEPPRSRLRTRCARRIRDGAAAHAGVPPVVDRGRRAPSGWARADTARGRYRHRRHAGEQRRRSRRAAVESGSEWPAMLAALDLQGPARQLANHCVLTSRSGDVLRLRLDRSGEIFRRPQLEQKLAQALSAQQGRPLRIEISVSDVAEDTPARRQAQVSDERLRAAEEAIEADPAVRAMREVFGATVQPGSVKPLN